MNRIYLFCLSSMLFSGLYAESDTILPVYKSIRAHYGFIIPHSRHIRELSGSHPAGLEFAAGRLHTTYEDWKVFNSYWAGGIKGRYFNFGNQDVLGSEADITLFAGPLLSGGYRHQLFLTAGAGISYHTRIFDADENPANQFFSSRISFPLYIDLKFLYRIGNYAYINISGTYNHISNGGIRQPNLGMNFPAFSAGMDIYNNPDPIPVNNFKLRGSNEKRKTVILAELLSSYRVIDSSGIYPEKGLLVYGLHLRASRPLGRIYSLNAGLELISDNYIKETVRRQGLKTDHRRFAITAGQDFTFGRILFVQYLGIYLYSPYHAKNTTYQKYELSYYPPGRIMYGVFLKAHTYVAELIGITLSFRFSGY